MKEKLESSWERSGCTTGLWENMTDWWGNMTATSDCRKDW